jgi:hypothetical protein
VANLVGDAPGTADDCDAPTLRSCDCCDAGQFISTTDAPVRTVVSVRARRGTFILQHSGPMSRGAARLTVVSHSGTDGLTGLTGNMTIDTSGGRHTYEFIHALPNVHWIRTPSERSRLSLSPRHPVTRTRMNILVAALVLGTGLLAFHPSRPLYMQQRSITFAANDGVLLHGTFSRPRWCRGAVPAMVIVHGSGPLTRDAVVGRAIGAAHCAPQGRTVTTWCCERLSSPYAVRLG